MFPWLSFATSVLLFRAAIGGSTADQTPVLELIVTVALPSTVWRASPASTYTLIASFRLSLVPQTRADAGRRWRIMPSPNSGVAKRICPVRPRSRCWAAGSGEVASTAASPSAHSAHHSAMPRRPASSSRIIRAPSAAGSARHSSAASSSSLLYIAHLYVNYSAQQEPTIFFQSF
jgi:hypothetical protein